MPDSITGAIALALVGALVYYRQTRRHDSTKANNSEPYGDFHLSFNQSQRPGTKHTEWLNMGLWTDASDFPTACENFATKLIQMANCQPGGRVLDVGHGSGDSLLLHLMHPNVPKPDYLFGITSLKSQHIRAVERVSKVYQEAGTNVRLYLGDAVYHPTFGKASERQTCEVQTSWHPLAPYDANQTAATHPTYTSILALDCAYHFKTREKFLAQSIECLEPGGTVALADMCTGAAPVPRALRLLRWFYCILFSIPSENVVTMAEYERTLVRAGYENVFIEDITQSVFPGFTSFLKSRGGMWWIFAWVIVVWWKVCDCRFVIAKGTKPR